MGLKAFEKAAEKVQLNKVLAQTQGLYTVFLAAGFIGPLFALAVFTIPLAPVFLACVLLAGIFGAITARQKILYMQNLAALIALMVLNLT